jgi:hypothetical protein
MLEVGYVYKDDMAGDEQTRHVACSFNMGMLAMAIGVGDLDRIGILDVLKRVEIHIANLGYQDANFFKHDLEEEKGDYCSIEKWNRSNEFFTWDDLLDVDFWLTLRRNDWGCNVNNVDFNTWILDYTDRAWRERKRYELAGEMFDE